MPSLAQMKCKDLPAGTPALGRARIDALLREVPGWSYDGKVIAKTWSFKNYYETIAFVNAVAWIGASRGPPSGPERRLQPLPRRVQHALDRRDLRERLHLRREDRGAGSG